MLKPLLALAFVAGFLGPPAMAQPADTTVVSLSDAIGSEISQTERDRYGLFPDVPGFVSARVVRTKKGARVEYLWKDDVGVHDGHKDLTPKQLDLVIRHVRLIDALIASGGSSVADPEVEARVLYQVSLRFARDRRYDLALRSLDDMEREYPNQYASLGADRLRDDIRELSRNPSIVVEPGKMIDRSGRTDVYIFAGYYGLWLSIAVPIAVDTDDANLFALSLIVLPAASILTAVAVMQNRGVTDGDASLLSSGAWLGTFQGIGWASLRDKVDDGPSVIGAGVLAGLAGVALAGIINHKSEWSAGHAELTSSSVFWGAWLGFLAGLTVSTDDGSDDDNILRSSLIGSAALTVTAAATTSNTTMTAKRVRVMNMGGVLGGIAGLGVIVLVKPGSPAGGAAILGMTSIGGGLIGIRTSRPKEDVSWNLSPSLELRSGVSANGRDRVPMFGVAIDF